MRIFDKRLSNAGGAVADLERAIVHFENQRDQALDWLSHFDHRRRELLLSGDSDALASLRAERLSQEDRRDAAEAALVKIRESLIQARDEARAKQLVKVQSDYAVALANYFEKAALAIEAFRAAIAVKTAASDQGFQNEIRSLPSPPHLNGNALLAPDLIDAFRAEWNRIDNRRGPKPASRIAKIPAPATRPAPVRLPHEAHLPPTAEQHGVRLDQSPAPAGGKKRALRRDAQPTDGRVLVVFVRKGVQLPDGEQSIAGDRVALPAEQARKLVEVGAADYLRVGRQIDSPSTDVKV